MRFLKTFILFIIILILIVISAKPSVDRSIAIAQELNILQDDIDRKNQSLAWGCPGDLKQDSEGGCHWEPDCSCHSCTMSADGTIHQVEKIEGCIPGNLIGNN